MAQVFPKSVSIDWISNDIHLIKNIHKVLFIYRYSAIEFGFLDKITKLYKSSESLFLDISDDFNNINDLVKVSKNKKYKNCDLVISVGGGYVTDFAKIICYSINSDIDTNLFNKRLVKIVNLNLSKKPKHIAYVTLPGSGSEASKTAVLNFNGIKNFFISNTFVPDYVIYMTETFKILNEKNIFYSILDSLTHGIESLVSPIKTTISEDLSNNAINVIYRFLLNEDNFPYIHTKEKSKQLALASLYGGLAQSDAGSGLAHALAHAAEQLFSVTHREAVSHFSFLSLKHNLRINPKKYQKISNGETFEKKLLFIYEKLENNIELNSKTLNFCLKNLSNTKKLINLAKKDICWRLNAVKPDEKIIISLINDAY